MEMVSGTIRMLMMTMIWTDADEIRAGTDPLNANDTPVDSFEIVIPGIIGLGAWDLIGIFGGVPIFAWLAFGFVTRNKRCARYEEMLESANSRQELEQVALKVGIQFDAAIIRATSRNKSGKNCAQNWMTSSRMQSCSWHLKNILQ